MHKRRQVEVVRQGMKHQLESLKLRGIDADAIAAAQFELALEYALEQDGPDLLAEWMEDLAMNIRQLNSDKPLIIPHNGKIRHV